MSENHLVSVLRGPGFCSWIDRITARIIRSASRHTPGALRDRLEEEWLADVSERRRLVSRLSFALGCYWAATVISHEPVSVSVPVTTSPNGNRNLTDHAHPQAAHFLRSTNAAAVMCEVNTTPLIDVMLVLLVTLILSIPVMTHVVKMDLPRPPYAQERPPPEVISLEIDFDGTVVWNGTPVPTLQQLENFFSAEARKNPQPEIHLRPDRRAKYDVVARVLASAQHSRMQKVGFVNTAEFDE